MKLLKAPLMAAMVGVSALGLSVAAPSDTQAQASVPVDVWALRSVVNAVQVSPDGKHVLVHKVESRDGEYLLEIYSTDDLSKPLRRLNADPMEIVSAQWVSNNFIFGTAWQVNRSTVKRPEQDVRDYLAYSYNLEENEFSKAAGEFQLIGTLPKEPNKILIAEGNAIPDPTGVDPFAAFRPRAYYKFNLESGGKELVMKGNSKFPTVQRWDSDGNPRYTSVLDANDGKLKEYYRKPGDGSWTLFQETDMEDQGNLYRILGGIHGIAGFSADDPNIGYLIDNRDGEDKAALYEFDFNTGSVGEKLVAVEDADIMGLQLHSIPGNDKVVAARYPGAKMERAWFDADEKALYDALEQQIPYAHQVTITSRSVDGKTMIVQNVGPRDPGSFWMVKNGQLAKLGSRNPLVNPEQLSDVKYIRYKARDGLEIPAYITIPKGEGPFPLVVQHNGGPHVNGMVLYDEIGQMLANAGYMVLHPENRISTGWGQKHFDAGYGEHGLAMQDDKDDGVKYLIEQGLVDPDRVAFMGWSYGGYAALVAASRENNLYQCSIAVAAVADAEKQYMGRRNTDLKALDEWSKRRGTIGVNPINEVSKVNIPLLMVHGDVDRRVMYYHFKDYKKAFEAAGKKGQFVTLEGADHFSNTLMFDHQQQLFTKVLDYLANDCGPGGL
ncbi:alpha/beta hydrolase family protein [Erythrobacter sp. GH1-10]|uniref:alpha/beta hydrolase family protein n=1 Tax=Erythrobacter sp. GH1-10 TaxID=3349334 RepID=UPI003877D4A8